MKKAQALTGIATSDATSITVRGRDLCSLIGNISFTDYWYLLLTGQEPTPDQHFFIDACLVTIAEHGMTPTAQAARMTLAADPQAIQGAVAAGLLGAGTVVMGTSEACGRLLHEVVQASAGQGVDAAATGAVSRLKDAGHFVPGFGHMQHSGGDPRTTRLLGLARERGTAGPYIRALEALERAIPEVWGKKLAINASAAIPAVLLDVGFPLDAMRGIPILARTGGLLAHLREEGARPIGFHIARAAADSVAYDGDYPT